MIFFFPSELFRVTIEIDRQGCLRTKSFPERRTNQNIKTLRKILMAFTSLGVIIFLFYCYMSFHLLSVYSPPKIFKWGWTSTNWDSSVISSCPWLDICLANKLSHFWISRNMKRSSDDLPSGSYKGRYFLSLATLWKAHHALDGALHLWVCCSQMDKIQREGEKYA